MKLRLTLLVVLVLFLSRLANAFLPDTLESRTIIPGVVCTHYALPGPFNLNVIQVDLRRPDIRMETYRPNGLSKTSVQTSENDREGHRVVAAVNADFFSFETGWPVGNQVQNGKPVICDTSSRSQLAISVDGRPLIGRYSFHGVVIAKDGTTSTLSSVNGSARRTGLVFYTSHRGSATKRDSSVTERPLNLLSPRWVMNDTLLFLAGPGSAGGMLTIPRDGGVISAIREGPLNFISRSVSTRDTLRIVFGILPLTQRIDQLISGAGRILNGGVNVSGESPLTEAIPPKFITARHPRTFVGINSDTTRLYLCTVDGRQSTSLGMSFDEMASFLRSISVSDAFNLDGGGSTTMVLEGKIINSPSDSTGERPVANTFQVIRTSKRQSEGRE
ncbi:MAG: hypothetical protein COS95_01800 [Ignavibacteriales bacterium CG07_land_8_20_14_0_80_59_12]|nr:MAG: hypothetical protein COS95_01800 [Ignavibacteriales bacterium CG07_land_8_20_14_0_80_59_12]